jgi:hypothetical protein
VVSDIPTAAHALGLATSAKAWVITEDLLHRTVGAEAPVVWEWVERRPFMARARRGLVLHDLARGVLEAEFKGRSPERYRSGPRSQRWPVVLLV